MDWCQASDHEWLDAYGHYRIVFRDVADGVSVPPGYHALVRSVGPRSEGFWSFAGAKRPYKTLEQAKKVCARNYRLWRRFLKFVAKRRPGRREAVAALSKTMAGKGYTSHRVMSVLPQWVRMASKESWINLLYTRRKTR